MSRTYRNIQYKHEANGYHDEQMIRINSVWMTVSDPDEYTTWKDDVVKVMQTDCMHRRSFVKKNVKHHTKKARRHDTKKALHRINQTGDYDEGDVVNREKKYLGFVRYWD